MDESRKINKNRALIQCGWKHSPHLTKEMIDEMVASCPPHLLDARMNGNPTMGSGNIYPIPWDEISIEPIRLQAHWKYVAGLDVGFNVTAAGFYAIDPDLNIVYKYDEYRGEKQNPASNAAAIRHRAGDWMPILIDPASRGRSQVDGTKLINEYRKEGLNVIPAQNGVEAGIFAVWQRLTRKTLKFFNTCHHTKREYETYRRDLDGKVVKQNDHQMDETRYALMGLDHAKLMYRAKSSITYKNPYKF